MSELPPRRRDVVAALRDADAALAGHAAETKAMRPLLPSLREADQALAGLPPPAMGERLAAAVAHRPRRLLPSLLAAPLPLAAAAALAVLVRTGAPPSSPAEDGGIATSTGVSTAATTAVTTAATNATTNATTTCPREQRGDVEVAVARDERCVVGDERFEAVLAPGSRLALGQTPRIEGEVSLTPKSAPLTLGLLERSGRALRIDGPLRLVVRPQSATEAAYVVIVEGNARLDARPDAPVGAPTRLLAVGDRVILDDDRVVPAAASVGAPGAPANAAAAPAPTASVAAGQTEASPPSARRPLSTAASPPAAAAGAAAPSTPAAPAVAAPSPAGRTPGAHNVSAPDRGAAADPDEALALLARIRSARAGGRTAAALDVVEQALATATSRRARVVLGFERAHILGLQGNVDEACRQLRAIADDAAAAAYEDNLADEREQLGCR